MVQPSIIALGAALFGIVLQTYGEGFRFLYIIGTACIMGAFIIALTAFLLFVKDWILSSGHPEVPVK